jgi:hypothetical protein
VDASKPACLCITGKQVSSYLRVEETLLTICTARVCRSKVRNIPNHIVDNYPAIIRTCMLLDFIYMYELVDGHSVKLSRG